MYRMGWTTEKMLNYYTEFLGERDKIDDEDLLTKEDKNKYEKDIEILNKNLNTISENHESQISALSKAMDFLLEKVEFGNPEQQKEVMKMSIGERKKSLLQFVKTK